MGTTKLTKDRSTAIITTISTITTPMRGNMDFWNDSPMTFLLGDRPSHFPNMVVAVYFKILHWQGGIVDNEDVGSLYVLEGERNDVNNVSVRVPCRENCYEDSECRIFYAFSLNLTEPIQLIWRLNGTRVASCYANNVCRTDPGFDEYFRADTKRGWTGARAIMDMRSAQEGMEWDLEAWYLNNTFRHLYSCAIGELKERQDYCLAARSFSPCDNETVSGDKMFFHFQKYDYSNINATNFISAASPYVLEVRSAGLYNIQMRVVTKCRNMNAIILIMSLGNETPYPLERRGGKLILNKEIGLNPGDKIRFGVTKGLVENAAVALVKYI